MKKWIVDKELAEARIIFFIGALILLFMASKTDNSYTKVITALYIANGIERCFLTI